MVEEMIVYRRRAPNKSIMKTKALKKQRCNELTKTDQQGVVVKGNLKLKQKQGIQTHNEEKIVAYFDLEVFESELVDVDLSVEASNRVEKVPFVRLTSESYGKPILGYPLEVGEITETLLHSKGRSVGSRMQHQLVWTTSKRTPVCYVTNSLSSLVSKSSVQAGELNVGGSIEEGVLTKEESGMRKMEKSSQACVPVELIFSKISSRQDLKATEIEPTSRCKFILSTSLAAKETKQD